MMTTIENGNIASTSYEIAREYKANLPTHDALPYYDDEIERIGMRAKVERELAAEMKNGDFAKFDDDRLPPKIELFKNNSQLLEQLQRIEQSIPPTAIDTQRYRMDDPSDPTNEKAWEDAIANAETQLMHSDIRSTNLELLKKFGANQWRLHNFQQEAFIRAFTQESEKIKSQSDNINRTRKAEQTQAGEELSRLNKRWAELLNRSLSVELANVVAQGDIEELQARKAELQKRLAELDV
jgi:pre-mRNA-splicing factor SPF27